MKRQYFGSSQPWLLRETMATECFTHSDSARPEFDRALYRTTMFALADAVPLMPDAARLA
jgi:hypothetical protein